MEQVVGIGGIFFRAHDPEALAARYQKNLGIQTKDGHADFPWLPKDASSKSGRTVWSLFPADTDYFGKTNPAFMINYVVPNLERMMAQLQNNGMKIEKVKDYDYGRFAWITDPEGNRIELWEPSASK
jgi:predicted enzyme related to lactoylglutathione lyase